MASSVSNCYEDDELIQVPVDNDSGHASDEELISVERFDGNNAASSSRSLPPGHSSSVRDIVSLFILLLVNLLNYMDRFSVAGILIVGKMVF